ncbi:MAG: hypothetical protein BGO07_00435 [Alphaproteobacteria bacterium 40-19]|nr:MAG: hypothetical protein BGO07_00435 [Alphaproteobacteria bacterium 40-19]
MNLSPEEVIGQTETHYETQNYFIFKRFPQIPEQLALLFVPTPLQNERMTKSKKELVKKRTRRGNVKSKP